MLGFMLDTDLCIRVLRGRAPALRQQFNDFADELCISTITFMELLHGAAASSRPAENRCDVERMAGRLQVLAFDQAAASHAADITASLRRRGHMIGAHDVQIAGHARSLGCVVITGNLGAFRRVDGLMSEDWLADS
jgi:tRNA(fMet)-specific endonuclease VapC